MKGSLPGPKRGFTHDSKPKTQRGPSKEMKDPLAGVVGRLSSGFTHAPKVNKTPGPGSTRGPVEGQNLRGYVKASNANLPTPQDVTVSNTGPRVRGNKRG